MSSAPISITPHQYVLADTKYDWLVIVKLNLAEYTASVESGNDDGTGDISLDSSVKIELSGMNRDGLRKMIALHNEHVCGDPAVLEAFDAMAHAQTHGMPAHSPRVDPPAGLTTADALTRSVPVDLAHLPTSEAREVSSRRP